MKPIYNRILAHLAQAGWDIEPVYNGWSTAIQNHHGLLFTTFIPNQPLARPPEIPQVETREAFIFCPQGLNSKNLQQPVLHNIQSWFVDLQTGFVFPYPPHPKQKTWDWLQSYLLVDNPTGIADHANSKPSTNDQRNAEYSDLDSPSPQQAFSSPSHLFIPLITYFLIALDVLVFLLMTLAGGSTNERVLILFGAKVNELILQGQVWRFFTSMFIHIGFFHLAFNLYALYVLGTFCEEQFGHRRFLTIYLLSGIVGGIASFLFTDALSAGASGAIFGVLGALVPYTWKRSNLWKSGFGKNLMVVILINLGLGLVQPGIDIYAHLGGLLFGMAYGFLFP